MIRRATAVLGILFVAGSAPAGDAPCEKLVSEERVAAAGEATTAAAGEVDTAAPFERELRLVYLFEGSETEFILVIGQSGFRTVDALEQHLETWPRGSTLRWAPGCVRFGHEPILSSEQDLADFRAFLEKRGIRFDLVPSG